MYDVLSQKSWFSIVLFEIQDSCPGQVLAGSQGFVHGWKMREEDESLNLNILCFTFYSSAWSESLAPGLAINSDHANSLQFRSGTLRNPFSKCISKIGNTLSIVALLKRVGLAPDKGRCQEFWAPWEPKKKSWFLFVFHFLGAPAPDTGMHSMQDNNKGRIMSITS